MANLSLAHFFENCYSAMTVRKATAVMVQWLKSCGKLLCVYKQLIYISMLCLPAMSYTRHVAMCSFSLILLHIITLAKYFCYSVLWYCVSHAMMNHVKLCVSWVDMCVCVQLSSIIYLCMYVYMYIWYERFYFTKHVSYRPLKECWNDYYWNGYYLETYLSDIIDPEVAKVSINKRYCFLSSVEACMCV